MTEQLLVICLVLRLLGRGPALIYSVPLDDSLLEGGGRAGTSSLLSFHP